MAEGFVCGRGRGSGRGQGSKLGPLELFVDGNVNEKLSAYGTSAAARKRATIGKTLHASVPIGEGGQTGFQALGIIFDNISAIQLVISNITHESPVGGVHGTADIFVAIYDHGYIDSSPLISSYIYNQQSYPFVFSFSVRSLTASKKYDFLLIATTGGENPNTNYGPTIEVSRISLLPM